MIAQRLYAVRRQGLAAIVVQSPTDGRLRGVRLSHSALTYQATAVASLGSALATPDLLYLRSRSTRTYAQAVLGVAARVRLPGRPRGSARTAPLDSLALVRPTVVVATPALLRGGARRAIEDDQPRRLLRRQKALDKQLRADVRETFGDRLRFVVCAGGRARRGLDRVLRHRRA